MSQRSNINSTYHPFSPPQHVLEQQQHVLEQQVLVLLVSNLKLNCEFDISRDRYLIRQAK